MKVKIGPYESVWKWFDFVPGVGVYTHVKRLAENYKNPVEFEPAPTLLATDAVILSIEYVGILQILNSLGWY